MVSAGKKGSNDESPKATAEIFLKIDDVVSELAALGGHGFFVG